MMRTRFRARVMAVYSNSRVSSDDVAEWRTPGGTLLHNSGSWVHEPAFTNAAGAASPYFPGSAIVVGDDGPPELLRLLTAVPDPA